MSKMIHGHHMPSDRRVSGELTVTGKGPDKVMARVLSPNFRMPKR